MNHVRAHIIRISANHHGVAADRYVIAEEIIPRAVCGCELLLLCPDSAAAREDIRRTLIFVRAHIIPRSANQHGVAANRYANAEDIIRRAIRRREFLLLGPGCAVAGENIGRTLICVIPYSANHHGVAVERYAIAEEITHCAVCGCELLLLGPSCAAAGEDIRRALIHVRSHIIRISANQHGVAADRYAVAEVVICCAVRRS